MNKVKDLIYEIKNKIVENFPQLNIYIKEIQETEEFFILIDDKNIYNSADFQKLLIDIDINIILKKEISNIYIAYILGDEKSSEKFYQIHAASYRSEYFDDFYKQPNFYQTLLIPMSDFNSSRYVKVFGVSINNIYNFITSVVRFNKNRTDIATEEKIYTTIENVINRQIYEKDFGIYNQKMGGLKWMQA